MIAIGSKLGIDATKKIPGEGFKRPWPPLIKMDAAVKAKVEKLSEESREPATVAVNNPNGLRPPAPNSQQPCARRKRGSILGPCPVSIISRSGVGTF